MDSEKAPPAPKLARRKENRRSTLKTGRTISERREQLEKASDRQNAHAKIRKRQFLRLIITSAGFLLVIALIIAIGLGLSKGGANSDATTNQSSVSYKPTIEIIDEDAVLGSAISDRIKDYVGQAEVDFRALGLVPVKAVIPTGAIREIDFYLEDKPGFIKAILDRDTAVIAEDAKRMLNYLETSGIIEFEYIDVRLEGKAYWK